MYTNFLKHYQIILIQLNIVYKVIKHGNYQYNIIKMAKNKKFYVFLH